MLNGEGVHQKIISVDESGFNRWLKRTRGRARRGQIAVRVIDGRRSRNIAVVFALSIVRGLLPHDRFPRAMTGDRFVDFFNRLSVAAGQGTITFDFDNAPAQKSW